MDRNNTAKTVIIANGRFPKHPVPLSYIEKAEYIVCCDGAANDFVTWGGTPDAIVGDCDSLSEENKVRFADILHICSDQESNDLTKSVRFCIEKRRRDIVIVGGTGKREDHTIGNISLLADYQEIVKVVMFTDWGLFTPIHFATEFKSFEGEQVSIFDIDRKEIVTHNLKYPINGRKLTNWWQGSLNESLGEYFRVETKGRAIVFQLYKRVCL